MQKLLTFFFSKKILAYMPYLMIKVLTIRFLTTSLVLNNWVLVVYALLPFIYEHCLHLFLHRLSLSQCPKTSSQTVHRRTSRLQGTIRKQTLQCVNFSARIHIPSPLSPANGSSSRCISCFILVSIQLMNII